MSSSSEVRFHPVSTLADVVNVEPEWIFKDFIERGEQIVLFGPPKVGKSQLALQLALATAKGEMLFRWRATGALKVVYLNFEISRRQFARRLASLLLERRLESKDVVPTDLCWPENLFFYGGTLAERQFVIVSSRPGRMEEKTLAATKQQLAELAPDLIVYDTLSYLHAIDENSNPEMTDLMERLRMLSGEAAHVIVHHSRKIGNYELSRGIPTSEAMRGASAIRGSADLIISLTEQPGGSGGGAHFELSVEARNLPSQKLSLSAREWGGFREGKWTKEDQILEFLLENRNAVIHGKAITEVPIKDVVSYISTQTDLGGNRTVATHFYALLARENCPIERVKSGKNASLRLQYRD